MKNKIGFTLLELLVVIGIIAILVGMGAVSYSTAQRKARDAKRKNDLKAVQNCLEQNYANNSQSPYQYQILNEGKLSGDINCGGTTTIQAPTDPLNNNVYYYHVLDSDSSSYQIEAALETESSPMVITNQQ